MKKFVPKIRDGKILGQLSDDDELHIDATMVMRCQSVMGIIRDMGLPYTIDPQTSKMQKTDPIELDAKGNRNRGQPVYMSRLPYNFSRDDLRLILGDSSQRLKVITACTDFQIDSGSKHVIPFYLCAEEINSQTFSVNIEAVTTVIKDKQKRRWRQALYPMIHVSKDLLSDAMSIRYMVSSYASLEIQPHIGGFYLMVDGLDFSTAQVDELRGILQAVRMLSEYGDVRVVGINAFGYAALLMGASCITSGLDGGESVSVKSWSQDRRPYAPPTRSYIREIFHYVVDDHLNPNYVCACIVCGGSSPATKGASDKKSHLFYCRKGNIEHVFGATDGFAGRLRNLLALYRSGAIGREPIFNSAGLQLRGRDVFRSVNRWLEALANAEAINSIPESERQLDNILMNDIDGLT